MSSDLKELIASKESDGNYNVLVGGDEANLTGLTVRAVLELQDHMKENDYKSTAVGKYQMIKSTLESLLYKPGTEELRNPNDFNLDKHLSIFALKMMRKLVEMVRDTSRERISKLRILSGVPAGELPRRRTPAGEATGRLRCVSGESVGEPHSGTPACRPGGDSGVSPWFDDAEHRQRCHL